MKKKRRPDRTGRSQGDGKFAKLPEWQVESEAYRALKVGPRALLAELKLLYNGSNNGRLFLSIRDAATLLHVDKSTASAWLWSLEATGFIRASVRGSQDVKERHATSWILTEHSFGDATATKDFMRWHLGMLLSDRPPAKAWAHIARASIASPAPSRAELFGDPAKNKSRGDYVTQAVRLGHPDAAESGVNGSNLSDLVTQISPISTDLGVIRSPTSNLPRRERSEAASAQGPPEASRPSEGSLGSRSSGRDHQNPDDPSSEKIVAPREASKSGEPVAIPLQRRATACNAATLRRWRSDRNAAEAAPARISDHGSASEGAAEPPTWNCSAVAAGGCR